MSEYYRSMAAEMLQATKECRKRRFHRITRVKKATKSVAKKLNRILTKAKTKLKKPTIKQTSAISNESSGCEQTIDDGDDIGMINDERINNNNVEGLDLNKTSTSSLHFIESSPFAVDECEWQIAEDHNYGIVDRDSGENYSSSNQLNPTLDQSICDKSSYGSLEECISTETVSLVSLIINRAQSRSPILFRPDFYVKKTTTSETTNDHHHHNHHTLYQVSNDYYSSIDDHTNLSERINAKKPIESNGIDSTNSKAKKTKNEKLSISKLASSSKYRKKLSEIKWSANIINVTQRFFNFVSLI